MMTLEDALERSLAAGQRAEIICLCGSTRFREDFERVERELTLRGVIVLSCGVWGRPENGDYTLAEKIALDILHLRKIDLADSIYVINRGGYIGQSTTNEIRHAQRLGKPIRYLEPARP